jgi:hypothetical protein
MEFSPEDFPGKEVTEISLSNNSGFKIIFEKQEGFDDIRVWQKLYGETVFIMSVDRHDFADLLYKLEDLL